MLTRFALAALLLTTGCSAEALASGAQIATTVLGEVNKQTGTTLPAPSATPVATGTAAPATTTTAAAPKAPDAELQAGLDATNQSRAAEGLPALAWSDALAEVARKHSADMADRAFFSHENPDGKSPFDRMRAAGITYGAAAENIAQNWSDDGVAVIDQWMNSPGHRANILDGSYRKMGLGVAIDGKGRRYWTQAFTD